MAKAYQVTSDEGATAFWCDNCEEWIEGYYDQTVLNVSNASFWEFGGDSYYEESETYQHALYFCDDCNEPVSMDSPPQMERQGTWICGECKRRYDDQESARDCCL